MGKDEAFKVDHDRPFLLSMANRGKDTNGSQFFVTTAPAPHLDKLHVVFGQVVSGKQVVMEIEALDTDKKDRPLQDARIVNCGELVRKTKEGDGKKKKKKKKTEKAESSGSSDGSSDSSDSSSSDEEDKKEKKAKKKA